ncbi:MAG: hypothetical protein L0215_17815 [Gemmataceae bacterium]|nr:hypothetical protein [Gemmataceae bacterium]
MTARMLLWLVVFACLQFAPNSACANDQQTKSTPDVATPKTVGIRELSALFSEQVDLAEFPKQCTLAEAIKSLQAHFAAKGKFNPYQLPELSGHYPNGVRHRLVD